MKVIAINRDQFYAQPGKAWAEIMDALNSGIQAPIFLDEKTIAQSSKTLPNILDIPAIVLTEYLTDNFGFDIHFCYKILGQAGQDILCLDLRGLTFDYIIKIAQLFAKSVFALKEKPTAYILLIDDLTGADITERWYKAFYIEPYPLHHLQLYLKRTLIKMRLRAFVLRYFGVRVENILRRMLQIRMKIKRR